MLLVPASTQAAGPRPPFQLPFPCGQQWRLDTWGHAPALDMVKEPNQVGTEGALLVAPAAGTVNQSFYHSNAGNVIQINHGGGWFTTYLHLQSRAVGVGEQVSQREAIGRVGRTGPTSNNHPHLHYELAIDSNGDGRASWGFEGSERVRPWFNGVEYGQSDGRTWRNVTSHNCGGGVGRGLDVASWGSDRLDVFARGSDNRLKHKWFDHGRWSGWEDLGGRLTSDPTAVSDQFGRINVFARGGSNRLYQRYYVRGEGWSDWQNLGGNLSSAPDVASWGEGRFDVFARGSSDQLIHKWYVRGKGDDGWSSWESLGGTLTSGPAAVSDQAKRINVFARGGSNRLYQRYYVRGEGWSDWQRLGGTLSSDPDVASWEPGRFDVFARGGSNRLIHTWYVRGEGVGGWSSWESLGGNLASAPTAVSRQPLRINVFARDNSGRLVQKYFVRGDGNWSTWQDLGAIP